MFFLDKVSLIDSYLPSLSEKEDTSVSSTEKLVTRRLEACYFLKA